MSSRDTSAMWRTMVKSEIREVVVTSSGPAGSLTMDADLLDAADLLAGEWVEVLGEESRAGAYVLAAERGSGRVELGGQLRSGAVVSLLSYVVLDDARARSWRPRVLVAGESNRVAPEVPALTAPDPVAETDDAARLDALLQRPED